jgi:hypothetical protein
VGHERFASATVASGAPFDAARRFGRVARADGG